jgi:hypothetical protein
MWGCCSHALGAAAAESLVLAPLEAMCVDMRLRAPVGEQILLLHRGALWVAASLLVWAWGAAWVRGARELSSAAAATAGAGALGMAWSIMIFPCAD